MNGRLAIALTLVLALSGSHAGKTGSSEPDIIHDTFPAEQAAVARVLTDLMEAATGKQLDRVDAFHLYGSKFSKFDDSGGGRQDAAASQAAERKGLSAVDRFTGKVEDLKVDVLGQAAIATFILDYSVEVPSGVFSGRTRSTMVFAKHAGAWKIVHEHHSELRPGP